MYTPELIYIFSYSQARPLDCLVYVRIIHEPQPSGAVGPRAKRKHPAKARRSMDAEIESLHSGFRSSHAAFGDRSACASRLNRCFRTTTEERPSLTTGRRSPAAATVRLLTPFRRARQNANVNA